MRRSTLNPRQQRFVINYTSEPTLGNGRQSYIRAYPNIRKRFHGSLAVDPTRLTRDAQQVAEEVLTHLSGLTGAEVTVTIEVEARMPEGAPEQVVRNVSENCRTLKFSTHGFESE